MPEQDAIPEIRLTTLKTPGYSFVDDPDKAVKISKQDIAKVTILPLTDKLVSLFQMLV